MSFKLKLGGTQRNSRLFALFSKKLFHCTSYLADKTRGENVRKLLIVPYQKESSKNKRKVSIVGGARATGSIMAYTLLIKNYVDEIILVDTPNARDKLCAEAFDLVHGTSVHKGPDVQVCLDLKKTANSDLVILNSVSNDTTEKTELDLTEINIKRFSEVVPRIVELSPDCVILVTVHPIDLMSYAVWKYSGLQKNRVVGIGTELDSARFRYHISTRLGINPYSVKGWIIGEHGSRSVPVWSSVNVAGTKLRDIDPNIGTTNDDNCWNELYKQVIRDEPIVRAIKGSTSFATGQICDSIIRAILCNYRTIHSVSVCLKGFYGIETESFLSFPCIIGNRGISEIVKLRLEDDEKEALRRSAASLNAAVGNMKFPCL